jgi:hypothetical protein
MDLGSLLLYKNPHKKNTKTLLEKKLFIIVGVVAVMIGISIFIS